jgi:hypothetical protein
MDYPVLNDFTTKELVNELINRNDLNQLLINCDSYDLINALRERDAFIDVLKHIFSFDLKNELFRRNEYCTDLDEFDSEELIEHFKNRNMFNCALFNNFSANSDSIDFKNFLCDIFDVNYFTDNETILKKIENLLKQIK